MIALSLAVLWAPPAWAQDHLGPEDVAPSAVLDGCFGSADFLSCLAAQGVPAGGVAFARSLAEDPAVAMPGLATGFVDLGQVDVAEVVFPFLANTNQQVLMVNARDGVVMPNAMTLPSAPDSPMTLSINAEYPAATSSLRYSVTGYRAMSGDRQRFVMTSPITDGCRACTPVAEEIYWFEFNNGVFEGVRAMGWYPIGLIDPGQRGAALMAGAVLPLRVALILQGYDSGPLRTEAGQDSKSALGEFGLDHCLGDGNTNAADLLEALATTPNPSFDPAPCAPR